MQLLLLFVARKGFWPNLSGTAEQWPSSCSPQWLSAAAGLEGSAGGAGDAPEAPHSLSGVCTSNLSVPSLISQPQIQCLRTGSANMCYQSPTGETWGLQWLYRFCLRLGSLWENFQTPLSVYDECWPSQGDIYPVTRYTARRRTLQDKER